MTSGLFERDDILELLNALVDHLKENGQGAQIRLVGSAAISIEYGDRPVTGDVDAGFSSRAAVKEAAAEVAAERGIDPDWLNDDVKMWMPDTDMGELDWKVVIDRDDVTVRVAPPDVLLAMKLRAGRGFRDAGDIDILLAACGVTSKAGALEIFNRYLPNEDIAARALHLLQDRFPES
jgi:hypothetical protein